jgi:hypothetical protein
MAFLMWLLLLGLNQRTLSEMAIISLLPIQKQYQKFFNDK